MHCRPYHPAGALRALPARILATLALALGLFAAPAALAAVSCTRTLTANVVALDLPLMYNRLGAQNVNGMIYALRRDVVDKNGNRPEAVGGVLAAGSVTLRPDKRPRPLVLRVAAGDCLKVNFQNLLAPAANPNNAAVPQLTLNEQVADRYAGFHPQGLQLANSIADDSAQVGQNAGSLVAPGASASYTFYAEKSGTFLVSNYGAPFGSEGSQGNSANGLFAAVNVEPPGARFYRSQLTEEELRLATSGTAAGGQPVVNYAARYPADCNTKTPAKNGVWCKEGKAGLPIVSILNGLEIVHGDLNAMIAGPNADGSFPPSTYPLESTGRRNPTLPNRLEPFREFTVIFHDEAASAQAFPGFFDQDPVFRYVLEGVRDAFMINYGSGGIGAEIVANRLGVGPMHDCLSCAYEEFFLTSSAVGDPAGLVDMPANVGLEALLPGQAPPAGATGPKASRAFYPDDPSNVHHSYTGDFVVFRNLHVGKEQHVFHLHNHQWLFNPNDDNSNYLDAQGIGPGSGYTYEINFGGSGNRNKTAGDAIFHCHFYPHFAMGMWEHWRVHDVFEAGTRLAVSGTGSHSATFALKDGTPAPGARALPDGEIVAGTPIPALLPLPGKAMAPTPGKVQVVANPNTTIASVFHATTPNMPVAVGSNAQVIERTKNPGFPFWIAGIEHTVGQRPPTPPLDMLDATQAAALKAANPLFADLDAAQAGGFDGGLPRHVIDGVAAGGEAASTVSRLDFSKVMTRAKPVYFPEEGTDIEKVAMAFHAQRSHASTAVLPNGTTVARSFTLNGAKPAVGAPYNEPCIDDTGQRMNNGATGRFFSGESLTGMNTSGSSAFTAQRPRIYKGANVQIDAVFNKAGYHYPQQRIIALWEDVWPTVNKQRPPEPLVMRLNTFDCAVYHHTNLVPEVYELDDYQVRTPTDIIGQHIHLPKWDLTSADGSANGWNYEDGTFSPGTVRERIHAINAYNAAAFSPVPTLDGRTHLEPLAHPYFGQFGRPDWLGARTTQQRWFADPVVNAAGVHRGLGIIFTHDHFGPSTHQQIGLYATVLAEPPAATWVHNETGAQLGAAPDGSGGRADGGPTSWQAAILTANPNDAFREFYFEYSDFQHAYEQGVYVGAGPDGAAGAGGEFAATADTFRTAINPPHRLQINPVFPDLVVEAATCPGGVPRPCPQAISLQDPGMLVTNYRNEPIALRVFDPNKVGPDGRPGAQADGPAGDLAYAMVSQLKDKATGTAIPRALPQFNTRLGDTPYPALTGDIGSGDPFTPIVRAYAGDVVRVKAQAGGHEEEHNITIHGVKWLQGGSGFGSAPNSGWKNAQAAGISEQFTFAAPIVPGQGQRGNVADFAYAIDGAMDGWWSGTWGLMRTYNTVRNDLFVLPNADVPINIANANDFNGTCPRTAAVRSYDVSAVLANDVLANNLGVSIVPTGAAATQHVGGSLKPLGGSLVYNPRTTPLANGKSGPLHDPTAILYVRSGDLDAQGKLKPGVPVEPLVLRAAAGECIEVTLRNRLPAVMPDLAGYNILLGVVKRDRNRPEGSVPFDNNLIRPSSQVGLHAQLAAYDVTRDDGANVGNNPVQTVAPGEFMKFQWYAGDIGHVQQADKSVKLIATPVEFGGANLTPADRVKQGQKSLVGQLVVEPQGATWTEDAPRRAAATVTAGGSSFRDFSVVFQKNLAMRYGDGSPVEHLNSEGVGIPEDSQEGSHMAINYGSEPLWFRFGRAPNAPFGNTPGGFGAVANAHLAYSNSLTGGDPATPVLTVTRGQPFRMHLGLPHGTSRGSTFNLHGHVWARDPYVCPGSANYGLAGVCTPTEVGSRAIGANPLRFFLGGQESLQPYAHFDVVLPSAGGAGAVPGDYLFRDQGGFGNTSGLWGIVRVQ